MQIVHTGNRLPFERDDDVPFAQARTFRRTVLFYPEHDHAGDGQEEVYLALKGSGWIDVEGERVELDRDVFVRIPAGVRRKVYAGTDGLKMLVVGACPGEVYKIPEASELTGVA